ncbi:protein kinase [Oryzobacter terrae]|uniref:protein kinase domain-containing protein n=1 Tax=Oryzobacter terrae TaxID=1620385 RepID=UPI003671DF18
MSESDELIAGRYRLLRQIGSGGMGVVWLAHDERLGRDVAVKRLHAPWGVDADDAELASRRAMREARITARLHHPHAVPVFDVVEHAGKPCLVMQHFPSVSLAELLSADDPLDVAVVARIGGEVATALAAAHEAGIVHRDVKPANVLVAADGTAKISDFGIAHALGDASLTSTGLVSGTPAYIAPEVARGEPSTPASDVFSLGSTLYTVLEGQGPFGHHDNPMAMLHRVAAGEVTPPQRSGELSSLLLAMLAPNQHDRPTMTEVAERLLPLGGPVAGAPPVVAATSSLPPVAPDGAVPEGEDLLWAFRDRDHPAGPAATPGPDPTGTQPVGERRRRPAIVLLALAAVVAGVVVGMLALRDEDAVTASPTRSASAPAPSSAPATSAPSSPPVTTSAAPPTTAPPTTAPPTPTPSPTRPATGGAPTAAQLGGAVTSYYALLPDDLDAGWARLSERYQRTTASSRSAYGRFWGEVDRVGVSDVDATTPDRVTATLRYEYADGRVFVERTSYRLVREDGVLKIDRSSVLRSTQE